MARRRAREFALQALYQRDIGSNSAEASLRALWQQQLDDVGMDGTKPAGDSEIEFTRMLVMGVASRGDEIDRLIEKASANWRIPRMPTIDRNILRLASYELLCCADIPASVSINEAIELAKRFGEKDSRAFVNGILDRIAAEVGRGGRHHRSR